MGETKYRPRQGETPGVSNALILNQTHMHLFFDTETNGLPKDYDAPAADTDNRPRMVQLAWILTNDNGDIITEHCDVIKSDGRKIPKKASDLH